MKIVKTTGPIIVQLLFNNSNKALHDNIDCPLSNCFVCSNDIQNTSGVASSTTNGTHFRLGKPLNCSQGGIYLVSGACSEQYTGKTVHFGPRMKEHLRTSKSSTVYKHMQNCSTCNDVKDFTCTYIENYNDRGKYSLSEREYLWNHRFQGTVVSICKRPSNPKWPAPPLYCLYSPTN